MFSDMLHIGPRPVAAFRCVITMPLLSTAIGLHHRGASQPIRGAGCCASVARPGVLSRGPSRQVASSSTPARSRSKPSRKPKAHRDAAKTSAVPSESSGSRRLGVGRWKFTVPDALQRALDAWGPSLRQRVALRRQAWFLQHGQGRGVSALVPSPSQLVVGTDCSGAEAPIWSLRAMGISHTHAFSSDTSPAVRKFIAACSPPEGNIFSNMLGRDLGAIPAHSIYVCGFPCKPFSSLRRHSTRLMREPTAKPFFAAVKVIQEHLPIIAVLENVMGIASVMAAVVSHFVNLRWYYVLVVPINSTELGEPIRRPRFYFVLLRRDVAAITDRRDLKDFVEAMLDAARRPCADSIAQRMLPASHSAVQQFCERHRRAKTSLKKSTSGKWHKYNEAFAKAHHVPWSGGVSGTCEIVGLRHPRVQTAWQLLSKAHASRDLVADVSQSVHRATVCCDGTAPTITPNGIVAVKRLSRIMLPAEKLLVHNFPLHKMSVPADMSEKELSSLGGNTMHLAAVGCALLIGIGAIDWTASEAKVGQKPTGAMPSREPAIYIGAAATHDPARKKKKRSRSPCVSMKPKRRK